MPVDAEGRVTGTECRAGSEGVVVVALDDGAGGVDDGPDAAKMVSDCVVRRHSRSVLQKSCSTVGACFRTFQGIGRGSSADGHGKGQGIGWGEESFRLFAEAVVFSIIAHFLTIILWEVQNLFYSLFSFCNEKSYHF